MLDKNYIDLQVAGSDWSYGSAWGDQMEDAILNWFAKALPNRDARILDAACGEGRGVSALIDAGFKNVIGVDIAVDKLYRGKSKGLDLHYCDIHTLDIFKDNEFDYSFSSHTLEHMYSIRQAIESLMRVSKILYYIIPIKEDIRFAHQFNPSHISPINNPQEFITILDNLNLRHSEFVRTRLSEELWGIVERN